MKVPRPIKSPQGLWHIPPLIPHWDEWIGPYEFWEDAQSDCLGLERTLNDPEYQMYIQEAIDDFEEQWAERLLQKEEDV